MKQTSLFLAVSVLLALAACGSDNRDDAAVPVRVTELAAGTYAVSAGDAANPMAGKYYAAADGSRLVVLNDPQERAQAVYRRDAGGAWRTVSGGAALDLLGSNPTVPATLAVAASAGRYSVRLADGTVAAFSVNAAGDIVPGATACKLSGKLGASAFPSALKLTLATSGCGALPAAADGFAIADGDYAPAAFRLLADASPAVLDLWAYRD